MKTLSKKLMSLFLALTMVFSLSTTAFATENKFSEVSETEAILFLAENISSENFVEFIDAFNESLQEDGIYLQKERGLKGKSAKVVAKIMLKQLYKIGSRSFNKAIQAAAKKLPQKAATFITEKITYEYVSAMLNVVANVEGSITNAIANQLDNFMPRRIADMASRIIVFILL